MGSMKSRPTGTESPITALWRIHVAAYLKSLINYKCWRRRLLINRCSNSKRVRRKHATAHNGTTAPLWGLPKTWQSWYTGRWWVGCYIWYSTGTAASPSPLLVPNVTAHPSTASVSITVLLYDGPLLCCFNVAIKGLNLCLFEAWKVIDLPLIVLWTNRQMYTMIALIIHDCLDDVVALRRFCSNYPLVGAGALSRVDGRRRRFGATA